MESFLFFALAGLIIGSSLGVLLLPNPMYAALSLVMNLLAVAGLFALLNAHFLSVVQITVYAGAVMVLVLFVIMLLNIKQESQKLPDMKYLIIAGAFLVWFCSAAFPYFSEFDQIARPPLPDGSVKNFGEILYRGFPFLFQLSGFLLLAAMVGAVMLAKRTKKEGA